MFGVAISRATGSGALLALKEPLLGFFSPNCSSQATDCEGAECGEKAQGLRHREGVRQVTCQRGADTSGGVTLFNFGPGQCQRCTLALPGGVTFGIV